MSDHGDRMLQAKRSGLSGTGGLYVVEFPERIKIGRSYKLRSRLQQHMRDGATRFMGFVTTADAPLGGAERAPHRGTTITTDPEHGILRGPDVRPGRRLRPRGHRARLVYGDRAIRRRVRAETPRCRIRAGNAMNEDSLSPAPRPVRPLGAAETTDECGPSWGRGRWDS